MRGEGRKVLLWPDIKAKDDHLKLRVLHTFMITNKHVHMKCKD